MFAIFTKRILNIFVLLLLIPPINLIGNVQAAPFRDQPATGAGPQVISAVAHDKSRPLAAMVPAAAQKPSPMLLRKYAAAPKTLKSIGNDITDASIVQGESSARTLSATMLPPAASFEGISANGYVPADANGDIGDDPLTGKKYYMQTVNINLSVWDVTDPTSIQQVYFASGNSLWAGFGGICESNNDGDAIVLFDHLAHRWMFSQFAISPPNNFHQCIAVSASGDPTGSWYRYDFLYSTSKLNDYAKFGVWPDGYYMSVNQYDGATDAWKGGGAVVFNRAAMLSGQPATMIKFDLGAVVSWYGGMLPSDLDGPAPAAGSPNYFLEWDDSTWHNDPTDTFRIWNFHADWANPSHSTFGRNTSFDPNVKIATANLDSNMCSGSTDCIPQPGTVQKLHALALGQLMYRLQYRNFGSYQTLVGNQTVDANGADKAGVYWFELRNSGAGWSMNQQGVYAPDGDNRWMGSAAMDKSGNLAIGYSVSSTTTYPSVRYAGRLVSDLPGTLPQAEASLVAGSGSQTGSGRWGDYSMLTLDPTDDCTFWYTQEYYNTTSFVSWDTRIGSFLFPSCVRTVSGNAGAGGAILSYTDGTSKTATSQMDGSYSFQVIAGWSGTVTPTHPCFTFSPTSINYNNLKTNLGLQDYTATFDPSSGCANLHVDIGGGNAGRYGIPAQGSQRVSLAGVNNGAVKVSSVYNNIPVIGAERVIYAVNGTKTSFTEMMALPDSQLNATYWLPWYNNVDLDTQLRFGNVSGSTASVHVYIGQAEMTGSPFNLPSGASTRQSFAGVNDGPVRIESNVNIVAAERVIYKVNGTNTSFSEMMGLPDSQLNTTYWLPWYNNVDLDTQLRIGNVSGLDATVHVLIGGTETAGSPFPLLNGESKRVSFAGVNNGPVEIQSDQNIVAAERIIYRVNNIPTSFSEMMGLPDSQLNTTYWLPWYNNVDLDTQLRIGNVSNSTATVHVFVGGNEVTPGSGISLAVGGSTRVSYPGVNNGPVKIVSDQNVVAAERVIYKVNNIPTSFSEMMALPNSQLNTTYWLPWYNNVDLDTQLRFGVP